MDQGKKLDAWSVAQTVILTATAAAVFVSVGRKDHAVTTNSTQISELRDISQDLVKSQVLSEANDANHASVLQELKKRLERLEQRGE